MMPNIQQGDYFGVWCQTRPISVGSVLADGANLEVKAQQPGAQTSRSKAQHIQGSWTSGRGLRSVLNGLARLRWRWLGNTCHVIGPTARVIKTVLE